MVDPNLQNPWGLAFGPTTPLWVADNDSGVATLYSINPGGATARRCRSRSPCRPMDSSPTGQVFNPTSGFVVTSKAGSGPGLFIFSAEGGQISAWNPAADPITGGAPPRRWSSARRPRVYKGLTIATTRYGTFLYASNFHDGTVDVFNSTFQLVHLPGGFRDRHLPRGYAPFGIQDINGLIYVTYAMQNAAKHDDVAGPGHGFIDIYTTNGFLVKRLVPAATSTPRGGSRWPAGVRAVRRQAPGGQLRRRPDPRVRAVLRQAGGALLDEHHQPIQIDDLWALQFGTATTGGTGTLLFSAGINDEKDGLVGSINPAP